MNSTPMSPQFPTRLSTPLAIQLSQSGNHIQHQLQMLLDRNQAVIDDIAFIRRGMFNLMRPMTPRRTRPITSIFDDDSDNASDAMSIGSPPTTPPTTPRNKRPSNAAIPPAPKKSRGSTNTIMRPHPPPPRMLFQ